MIEMDETEHDAEQPAKWWELLDDTAEALQYSYDEIERNGSPELKAAMAIILGGHRPGVAIKEESA